MSTYGLSDAGFVAPRQAQIISDLQAAFQAKFGATVNLSSATVFGQLIGIFSEREALLWEALQDDVLSGTPAGAQGIYVDNLLALTGLTRLAAQATVTNPTPSTQANGITLFGLVLRGDPGTVIPRGAVIQTSSSPVLSFTLDNAVTLGGAVNAVQDVYFTGQAKSGALSLTFAMPSGAAATTDPIPFNALPGQTVLNVNATPKAGSFTLTVKEQSTDALAATATAADVQAALRKLDDLSQVVVQGAWPNLVITWPTAANPLLGVTSSLDVNLVAVQSIAAAIQSLKDADTGLMPLTDVVVTSPSANQWRISFGAGAPADGQPSSAAKPQALAVIAQNTLLNGTAAVNAAVATTVSGVAAQGVGTATCTQTGDYPVLAGALNVIGSSQQGWVSVTNELDALVGRAIETDTEAMARRASLLASPGAGPLAATLGRLQQLDGVTRAIGFENLTAAALQRLTFLRTPTSGTYCIGFGGGTTDPLPFNASSRVLQKALEALPNAPSCTVSGAYTYGFVIDFEGALGGQALPLMAVAQDTTGAQLTATFGRPPKSVEYVVQGGDDHAIAQAILDAAPGGIATYGAPVLLTTGSFVSGSQTVQMASVSNVVVGQAVFGQGLNPGSVITAIDGTQVTLSLPALSTASQVPLTVNQTLTLKDLGGNPTDISFTRPRQVPVYLKIALITDLYNSPGDETSGKNANAVFDPASLQKIEGDVIDAVNAVAIGGLITLHGTDGIGSSFRDVPGIVDVTLTFDSVPNPTNTATLRLLPDQVALASSFTTEISYS